MTFGEYLREERKKRNWTQTDLAEKTAGAVSQASLSTYESGKARPAHAALVALLEALEVVGVDRAVALHIWAAPLKGENE